MYELNLDKSKKYLLACSYGPDSMALFHILRVNGYNFECAIVNYNLRLESKSEVDGLVKYASLFNIKVHVLDNRKIPTGNIESYCRKIRYNYFKKLCDEFKYDSVLVAHHQDDLIETYLMQKRRQNRPIYYGIQENTVINGVNIIRPLLQYSKADLLKICEENHVPYAIDKTNFDTSLIRNKYRHDVVLNLSSEDRKKMIEKINEENANLASLIESIDLTRIHELNYLKEMDEIKLSYALNILVKYIDNSKNLSKNNVGEIRKAILSEKPNVFFKIKTGLYFIKEYDYVDIIDRENELSDYSYVLEKPGVLDTPYFHLDFSKNSDGRNVCSLDYPIIIRNVRIDDYIYIKGYKVFARRLLIDWKMPLRLRNKWPIILNKNGEPLYIPRYQKDFVPSSDSNFFVKI